MIFSVNKSIPNLNNQHGAVLFVSLIFLLLMTIIGVTSMRSTTLEEKMASNTKNMNLALQAAEAALRAGESHLVNASIGAFHDDCTGGYCSYVTGAETPLWKDSGLDIWNDADKHQVYDEFPDGVVASKPQFIIEKMTSAIAQGAGESSLVVGFKPKLGGSSYYQVTARGVGGAGEAEVFLQSYFRQ